jgi:hypothetical protein
VTIVFAFCSRRIVHHVINPFKFNLVTRTTGGRANAMRNPFVCLYFRSIVVPS